MSSEFIDELVFAYIERSNALSQLNGKGVEFTVDELVIVGYGPSDVVGVNKDYIDALMNLSLDSLGVFKQVLSETTSLSQGSIFKVAATFGFVETRLLHGPAHSFFRQPRQILLKIDFKQFTSRWAPFCRIDLVF